MTKTPTSWIDVTTSHFRANPGKSLMDIMPAAKAEWKKIKDGSHPSKTVGKPKKHSKSKKHGKSKKHNQRGGAPCTGGQAAGTDADLPGYSPSFASAAEATVPAAVPAASARTCGLPEWWRPQKVKPL